MPDFAEVASVNPRRRPSGGKAGSLATASSPVSERIVRQAKVDAGPAFRRRSERNLAGASHGPQVGSNHGGFEPPAGGRGSA